RLHNGTFGPEFTKEPEEMRFEDEHEPDFCKRGRWVAELDGKVVGIGGYSQHPYIYNPRRFSLTILVEPALLLHGIGGRLYDRGVSELAQFEPERVDEWSREDMPCRIGFFEHRGFVADMRMWTSVLDLERFDSSRFGARVSTDGLRFATFAELGVDD